LSASSTWRALVVVGSTLASTEMNRTPQNGIPATIRNVALTIAICAGRRMTNRDRRYQAPFSAGLAFAFGGARQPLRRQRVHAWPEHRQDRR